MRRLFLTLQLFIGISSITIAQRENNFDVSKFEKALIHQMEITFPSMQLDAADSYGFSQSNLLFYVRLLRRKY